MKKVIFISLAFLSGCFTSQNPDERLLDPEEYIPKSTSACSTCSLKEKMIEQIFLFRIIDEIGFSMDLGLYSFDQVLYNSRIFKTNQKEFIINVIALNQKNEQEINPYEFKYNGNGQIVRVDYLVDPNYRYEFTYDKSNFLSSCKKYLSTIEQTTTQGNEVTYYPTKQTSETVSFIKENGRVVGYKESPHGFPHDFSYLVSTSDTSVLYMKEKSIDIEKMYGFDNELIKFVMIRKYSLTANPGAVWRMYTFSHTDTSLEMKEFRQAEDTSSVLNHFWTFNVEYGPDFRFNRIKRTWGTQIEELFFQYRYIDNSLIGYDIFKAEYNENETSRINMKEQYSFEKSFTRTDNVLTPYKLDRFIK